MKQKNNSLQVLLKTKKDPTGSISFRNIRGLYSPELKAVPHPTQNVPFELSVSSRPTVNEIHTTDLIAEVPHLDYNTIFDTYTST